MIEDRLLHTNIGKALYVAAKAHDGQVDKAGVPYMYHVTDVWHRTIRKGLSEVAQVCAILHDVVEDSIYISCADIQNMFGYEIAMTVNMLTRPDGMSVEKYYERVLSDEIAVQVKLCDVESNVARLAYLDDEDLKARLGAKYIKALGLLRSKVTSN